LKGCIGQLTPLCLYVGLSGDLESDIQFLELHGKLESMLNVGGDAESLVIKFYRRK